MVVEPKSRAGRNSKGQFAPGNKLASGNPTGRRGRPSREVEQALLDAFRDVVTPKRWKVACLALLVKAENGNIYAWKTLAPYAMGQPPVRVDVEVGAKGEILAAFEDIFDQIYGGTPAAGESSGVPAGTG